MKLATPTLPRNGRTYGAVMDISEPCELGVAGSTLPSFSESEHQLLGKHDVSTAPTIHNHGDSLKMVGIHTIPYVAPMVKRQAFWYFAFVELVVIAMGQVISTTDSNTSVSLTVGFKLPYPARCSIAAVLFDIAYSLAHIMTCQEACRMPLPVARIAIGFCVHSCLVTASTPAVAISAISVNMSHYLGLLSGLVSAGVDSTAADVSTSLIIPEGRSFAH